MQNSILIPLSIDFGKMPILERKKGNVEESIDNILDMIVFTPKGSFSADPEFGFEYWNHEFSNVNVREFNNNYIGLMMNEQGMNEISRKKCEDSLKESILTYEPRLTSPEVKIELNISAGGRRNNKQSKYEMRILISGSIDEGLGIKRPYEKKIAFMVEPVAKKIGV